MDFNIASTGISTAQKNINVLSNNIANETTEGYRTQTLQTEESISLQKNGFFQGTGTKSGTIVQNVDTIIYNNMLSQIGDKSYSETLVTYGKSIENLFQDNNNIGLNTQLEEVYQNAINLKNDTENQALSGIFLDSLSILTKNINDLDSSLKNIKSDITSSIKSDIEELNSDLKDLQKIEKSLSISFKPELADKKAILEQSISSKIDAEFNYDLEGNYYVMIGNNRVLDKSNINEITFDENKNTININNTDITNNISKGSISAKANLSISKNNEIDKNIYKLNLYSNSIIENMNDIYSEKPFENINSVNIKSEEFEKEKLLDVKELKGLKPGDITIKLHTDPIEEIKVNINHDTTFESLKQEIEEKSNNKIKVDISHNSFNIISEEYPAQIIDDENTNFNKVMGYNKLLSGDNSSNISVNETLLKNPEQFIISNDKLEDNANYDMLDKLSDLKYKEVDYKSIEEYQNYFNNENFNPSNTTLKNIENSTISDFYLSISMDVSKTVYNNEAKQEIQNAIYQTTLNQYEEDTKVNKDEELVKLMEYQSAYSANAKVISAMNEMFDTILKM